MPAPPIPVARFELKYTGVFDYEYFYKEMIGWLKHHGFVFEETMHKFKPPEIELGWKGTRRDTGYRKTTFESYFHAWYFKEVEVTVGGKKKKMASANIQIHMSATMELDYAGTFDKNNFTKALRSFIHKFVFFYKYFILDYDKVYFELQDFQTKMKSTLDMSFDGGAF